jgi:peptide-methionine (S)-S-oxide reductase
MNRRLLAALLVSGLCLSCGAGPQHDLPVAAQDLSGQKGDQTLVLAGGCFWATQAVFEKLNGVSSVVAGYAGGKKSTATYDQVITERTGHAESVQINYDPSIISFGQLLRVYFTLFDPTTLDRQGNDIGTSYRSAIFYANDDQKRVAAAYIKQLTDDHVFADPIVTSLEPLNGFYPAEDYHQDYAEKNPNDSYVQVCDVPKLALLKEKFAGLLKPQKS